MTNSLKLMAYAKAGVVELEDYFLCDCLSQADLPWDPNQTEW
jgi:hypothetical protein